jgi:hypothetical protein
MTVTTFGKYRTVNYDKNGKPVSVLLNLKNKAMKRAYEIAMEELEDEIDTKEAMKRMKELDEDPSLARPFDEFVKEYMADSQHK